MKANRSAPLLPRRLGPVIQLSGLIRKEVTEVLRQPRVLLVLVVGPFLVLLLFAMGFDREQTVLDTVFVGPEDGIYEQPLADFGDDLGAYISVDGYTSDMVDARRRLLDEEVDLIVVLPPDPAETVMSGERATIEVIHDKLDPIQQTAVSVSTQVAVQELNARILEAAVGAAQGAIADYEESLSASSALVERLGTEAEADDTEAVAATLDELDGTTAALASVVGLSNDVALALGADDAEVEAYGGLTTSTNELRSTLRPLIASPDEVTPDDAQELDDRLETIRVQGETVTTLEPSVVVRPFEATTAALERRPVTVMSFFATGAIALLLQHMVFTFAAMSLVGDRGIGLFELFRIGPVGAGRVLVGKYVAFTLVGGIVSTALLTAVVLGLDVPMRGSIVWLAVGIILLLLASIGFGMVVSLVSSTPTQAVQYALLALLASLFFCGLFLDIGSFVYPVKALIWAFPATYGTRILRDVMLRGADPDIVDLLGLVATSIGFFVIGRLLFGRRLRAA